MTYMPLSGSGNRFIVDSTGRREKLDLNDDYVPLPFSAKGRVKGQLVFAGYGISAPEYGYDDFAGIDVRGKIAVILRHEPQEYDGESIFAGKIYTEHSQLFAKAANASLHGARAVVMVNDTDQHGGSAGRLAVSGPPSMDETPRRKRSSSSR